MKLFRYFCMATLWLGLMALALFFPSLIKASDTLPPEKQQTSAATILYVDRDAAGATHNGQSWATAYTYLQDALDWTNTHTTTTYEIWVAEGVYYPDEGSGHINNAVNETFWIKSSNVQFYGGFGGTEINRDQRDWSAHPTILSGDIDQNDINTDGDFVDEVYSDIAGNNAHHVIFASIYISGSILPLAIDGFIITGAGWNAGLSMGCESSSNNEICTATLNNLTFSGNRGTEGGGMYIGQPCDQRSQTTLTNVTFTGNLAAHAGGGLRALNNCNGILDITLNHVTFDHNEAGTYTKNLWPPDILPYAGGGGIANEVESYINGIINMTLIDTVFIGNKATRGGGGGMMNVSQRYGKGITVTLQNVDFIQNESIGPGGAIYNNGHYSTINPILTNVTFSSNKAVPATPGGQTGGGGIYNTGYVTPRLNNVVFQGNYVVGNGGGICDSGNVTSTLVNVTFSGNQATISGGGFSHEVNGTNTLTMVNSIVWGNFALNGPEFYNAAPSPIILYNDIKGGYPGTGNLNIDPQFIAPLAYTAAPTTTGNYRLQSSSPALNAGNNAYVTVSTDRDGKPRIADGTVDLGAYEAGGLRLEINRTSPHGTITSNPAGINCGSICVGGFAAGTVITLTVVPDPGWAFSGWSGGLSGSANPAVFTLQNNTVITAAFTTIPIQLLYVNRNAPGPAHNGLSWATAFTTLQEALNLANANSGSYYEIWVAQGLYYPDEGSGHLANAVTETFKLAWNNVQFYGGFAGTETHRTQRDWTAHPTILSGDLDANDRNLDGNSIDEAYSDIVGGNAYHIITLEGRAQAIAGVPTLDGFIITGGSAAATTAPHSHGGGLYCRGTTNLQSCNITLNNLIFSGNLAAGNGGGLYSEAGNNGSTYRPTLSQVTFTGNRATDGGGYYNLAAGTDSLNNPVLTDVTFNANLAIRKGGGMYNLASASRSIASPLLTRVTFHANLTGASKEDGAGLSNEANTFGSVSSPIITDGVFSNNHSSGCGGGIANWGKAGGVSSPQLTRVTFSHNEAEIFGGGMFNYAYTGGVSSPALNDVLFIGNKATGERAQGGGISGAAVHINSIHSPVLNRVSFVGNQAKLGGGLYAVGINTGINNPVLTNVLFNGNLATQDGGALYNTNTTAGSSNMRAVNTTFSGNRAANEGGAIYSTGDSSNNTFTVINSILWGNAAALNPQIASYTATLTVSSSDIQGGYPGTDNLNVDPRFIAPIAAGAAPTTTGNYRLLYGSPAIDTGTHLSITSSTDRDGNSRLFGSKIDLGAYEAHYLTVTINLSGTHGRITSDPAGLDCPTTCIYGFNPGTVVTLTATPDADWDFGGWSGSLSGFTNPLAFTLENSTVITAAFNQVPRYRLYVDRNATGTSHDGLSWSTAYTNVQDALAPANAASDAFYEIWVAQGVYYPDQGLGHSNNAVTETFRIDHNNILLYGGFVGTETLRTERNWTTHPTILSGDIDGNDRNTDNNFINEIYSDTLGNNAYHILTLNGQPLLSVAGQVVIDGFIITGGHANDTYAPHDRGGGFYCSIDSRVNNCSPTLSNLIFSGNRSTTYGGALYNGSEGYKTINQPVLSDITFTGNESLDGGAMYNLASSQESINNPRLTRVTFNHNIANGAGGGLHDLSKGPGSIVNPILTDVTFIDNRSGPFDNNQAGEIQDGGGFFNRAAYAGSIANPILNHVTFNRNQSTGMGGGGGMSNRAQCDCLDYCSCPSTSNPILNDVTFIDNEADINGGGMVNLAMYGGTANPTLTDVTFTHNWARIGFFIGEEPQGGGLYNQTIYTDSVSNLVLTNVTFNGNRAKAGGGLYNLTYLNASAALTLTNVLFQGNYVGHDGGALYNSNYDLYSSEPSPVHLLMVNTTFSGNRADRSGGAIYNLGGPGINQATVVNSILWGNSAVTDSQISNYTATMTVNSSDIQGGYPGTGNLNLDPLFIAPIAATAAPTTTGNYRVSYGSPAIDSGSNLSVTAPTDLDGHPRINGPTVDMGAYETLLNHLTIHRTHLGGGLITSDPPGIVCGTTCSHGFLPGTVVTLTLASTDAGLFQGWTGAVTGTATTIQLTMDAPKNLMANLHYYQIFLPVVARKG